MKYIKVWGGLGNQLFQYAFSLFLQDNCNETVNFVDHTGKPYPSNGSLSKIIELSNDENLQEELSCCSIYFSKTYRVNRKILQLIPQLSSKIIVERLGKPYPKSILDYSIYDGYWQDLQFVESVRTVILSKLKLASNTQLESINYASFIRSAHNTVSVHVRRGDYLQSKYHVVQGKDYINKAIHVMNGILKNPIYFVFSDNIQWAKENIQANAILYFIENDEESDAVVSDFNLMMQCQHHIISNSTFSWWPAWLNSNKNKQVIAPSKWFINNNNSALKILPKEWILL